MPNTGATAFSSYSGTGWTTPSNASADDASYAVSPSISDASGGGCFVAGSMVATSRGEIPIEKIKLGDTVRDMFGNDVTVTRTIKHRAKEVCMLTIESFNGIKDRTTVATPDHPFRVEDFDDNASPEYRWVQCGDLVPFNRLSAGVVALNGRLTGDFDVYNLTVDGSHTFVVNGNVVHNK